ncbi:uncharacterized protein [Leptinotarsa decemlineata]|uniref:uncharacterized protein n=1 Tax=Leptinotarsa decemlineata TaxID=7539 RepID=UPI000C252B19|nr:uncharacterized protein LOC111511347 [Leptinotarsa decemlineata]
MNAFVNRFISSPFSFKKSNMDNVIVLVLLCFLIFGYTKCQDLHLIENKPGLCFKIHTPSQPRLFPNPRRVEYPDLFQSCTEWLKEDRNCLGLRTQNNEVLVLYCKGVRNRSRPGCYKIINKDKREEIVCQKINKKEGCETITTRTNLTIVVSCSLRTYTRDVKIRKSLRQQKGE